MSKINLLKNEIKDSGWLGGFKRALAYIFSPLQNVIQKSRFLLELRYHLLPRVLFFSAKPYFLKISQTDLVEKLRTFWYQNILGEFDLDGEKISRKDIFTFGGPNPEFVCPICQKSEWLSRVRQKNLFVPHNCPQASKCADLCQKQGNELWTHLHQNFNFSLKCDPNLPAAKCLIIDPQWARNYFFPHCDIWMLTFRRRLAYCCQVEIAKKPFNINWSKYDFLFIVNDGQRIKFKRPSIPVIMYGHDWWPLEKKGFQWMIDWLKPDYFLSFNPTIWQENYKFPFHTKMVFYPVFDTLFFSRPNLGEKKFDLLVIGATTSQIYASRISLINQLAKYPSRFKIEFSQTAGSDNVFKAGPVERKDIRTGKTCRLLNKWSEYLGSARYVIFGGLKYPALIHKHFEALGSGAIPIFPESADFKYLGIKPFEHYIPLSEVENNNEKLFYFLDNYPKFKYIAENVVNWYKNFSDKMTFSDFENLIGGVANYKYAKRSI